jgi:hypothetical protein
LGISPLSEKIIEYRNKLKAHLQKMEHTLIPLQAYKNKKGKGKAVPLHAMEALGGRGGIAPTHSRPWH